MSRAEALYARLPVWAQHGAVSAYGLYWHWLRFGPGFARCRQAWQRRQALPRELYQAEVDASLTRLLTACAEAVPYYRETWSPAEHRGARAGRLAELPLLPKEPLRRSPEAFLRQDAGDPPRLFFATSGSTGTPLSTRWSVAELRDSLALREVRSAGWAGVSFTRPRATFSGRLVVPDPESPGPFHRFNRVERQVYLSAFHLSRQAAPRYLEPLRRHRVAWGTGYAVSWALLARKALEAAEAGELPEGIPRLEAVVTTSEKVTPAMRRVIEEAFGGRVFEEYSTVDNTVFASECEAGRLHVSTDAGILEILRPDGSPCEPGEVGEVVGTGLLRRRQPFVRFRLGDLAAWGEGPCPCGRHLPVLQEVTGRLEDVVVGPDGRQMVRFHGLFLDVPGVVEAQVIQERLDHLRLRIVPAPGFDEDQEQTLRRRVHQRLGPAVEVTIETVERLPRTAAGKLRAVISHLGSSEQDPPPSDR